MKDEKPTIELYMYSLNQEFPVGKGHSTFIKRRSEVKQDSSIGLVNLNTVETQVFNVDRSDVDDWLARWVSNAWVENHTKTVGSGSVRPEPPLINLIVREEDFGGIVFEPRSDRVFKVNKAGLELLREVQKYCSANNGDISTFSSTQFSHDEYRPFISFIEGAGLWMK